MGVVLASAQELLPASDAAPTDGATKKSPLGPVKKMLLIAARDLDEIEAADVRLGDREKEVRESREREGECCLALQLGEAGI